MQTKSRISFTSLIGRAFQKHIIAICLASAFIAALIGPFGTYGRPGFIASFAVWTVLIFSVNLSIYLVQACLTVALKRTDGIGFQVLLFVGGTVAGALSLFVLLTYVVGTQSGRPPELLSLAFYVGAIFGTLQLVRPVIGQLFGVKVTPFIGIAPPDPVVPPVQQPDAVDLNRDPPTEVDVPARVRLADRLELSEAAHILKISADGHFVEVKTCTADVRTRMRFADAVAEVDGTDGIITHRSHWVARMAIKGWVPSKQKPYVLLHDDTRVPVSKTYRQDVAALGLVALSPDEETV